MAKNFRFGIDINLFRTPEGVATLRKSQKDRYKDENVIDTIVDLDSFLRKLKFTNDKLLRAKKLASMAYGKSKKKQCTDETPLDLSIVSQDYIINLTDDILATLTTKKLSELISHIDLKLKDNGINLDHYEEDRLKLLKSIGNIVHETVPISDNEEKNAIVKIGATTPRKEEKLEIHVDLLTKIGGTEFPRGVKVAGNRAYYLCGNLVKLNMALMKYSMDFLEKQEYKLMYPPLFMNKDVMSAVAQLEQFDEELYACNGDGDKYLIATSEQPLIALHMDETLHKLPIKYAGYSTCFRKEAGAHTRDTRGIFRVHQFEKIEQICITSKEESWNMMEQMIKTAEDFYDSLGIAYRTVAIVSGALNNAATKKYDIEGFFPGSNTYRELVSCSNCTDYQSRCLGIKDKHGDYVHMLNSTLCANTRTLCVIAETYQTGKGIIVPEVLRSYMGNMEIISFE